MTDRRPLRVAVVAGEESGDLLGHDVVAALAAASGRPVELVGTGGRHLQTLGLKPLFDASEIALMGVTAILRDLPRLMARIRQTAAAIVAFEPDCVITVDSPEFSLRVARKVRAARPSIPIVHYVCPSVWAWRPGRAVAMRPYVDHILCLLPFEPAELVRLNGPPGTFVGHPLSSSPGVRAAAAAQAARTPLKPDGVPTLAILPGSRRSEVKALLDPFADTIAQLRARGHRTRLLLPTVPHVEPLVREMTASWVQPPTIVTGAEGKWHAFGEADAALAASGTVTLELALCGVPFAPCYKVDLLGSVLKRFITVWSASLPNLIADRPVVMEFYDDYVRPETLARHLESLFRDTAQRQWQLQGFAEVRRRLATERPAGERAAEVVLGLVEAKRARH